MERGEWENDPEYPRAPLPAHERTWRHPSEQGATQWVQSEPPLVVGRGLSVATGTVGAVLAVGLLWLMIPHENKGGSGAAVQASTTIRAAITAETPVTRATLAAGAPSPVELSSAPVTTPPSTRVENTVAPTIATVVSTSPSAPPTSPPATSAPTTAPEATTEVRPPVETIAESALAVAMAPGHFVAATAAAVGDQTSMNVRLPSGETVVGSVVSVDNTSGIAVLSLPDDVGSNVIEPSQAAIPTDGAVVLTPEPTPVSVWRDDTGTQLGYDPTIAVPEGSLVLDTDQRLIGMCTSGATGIHVLDAASLLQAINAAIANESPVWLGLHIKLDETDQLRAFEVLADGPALTAGVPVGSAIQAIDGVALAGSDGIATLRSTVMGHRAGDVVTLTVLAPDALAPVDIAVTLTPNPGAF